MKALIALTVVGLVLGTQALAQEKKAAPNTKPATTKKTQSKVQPGTKFVDVTGSNIKVQVKPGKQVDTGALRLTVIDTSAPEHRGYTSPMEMLSRNPTVFAPPGGRY